MSERQPDESFEDYRMRLRMEREITDHYLRGRRIWPSASLGTWVKPENRGKYHGEGPRRSEKSGGKAF